MNKLDTSLEHIISLMFATGRLIREQNAAGQRPDPNTVLQLETLRYVAERGQPAMKDVARYLCVAPPSATSLIDHLVQTGLLKRTHDLEDRRITRLSITARGQTSMARSQKLVQDHMKWVFKKLNTQERSHLIQILKKLSRVHEKKN